jgi:hypothetical protein
MKLNPLLTLPLLLACRDKADSGAAPLDSGDRAEFFDTADDGTGVEYEKVPDEMPVFTEAIRTRDDVYHVTSHLFTNYWSSEKTYYIANRLKEELGVDDTACYEGLEDENGERRQIRHTIQTEYTPGECSNLASVDDCIEQLNGRLDALAKAGFIVELLLPLHGELKDGWLERDWSEDREWEGSWDFLPYDPAGDAYEALVEGFTLPIIENLVASDRVERLSGIWVSNETHYDKSLELSDEERQALAEMLWEDVMLPSLISAGGQVPVGPKFARFISESESYTGWETPQSGSSYDGLDWFLKEMIAYNELADEKGEEGTILGYDVYSNRKNDFDQENYWRLTGGEEGEGEDFLSNFDDGRFRLAEVGVQYGKGVTKGSDLVDITSVWCLDGETACVVRALNFFGVNAGDGFWVYDEGTDTFDPRFTDIIRGQNEIAYRFLHFGEEVPDGYKPEECGSK